MSLKTPHFGVRGSVRRDCEVANWRALNTSLWESRAEESALSRAWSIGLGKGEGGRGKGEEGSRSLVCAGPSNT